MNVGGITRGATSKTVHVIGTFGHTDDEILEFVFREAGETKGSLYGWQVINNTDTAVVVLFTD